MQLDHRRPAVLLLADPPRAGVLAVYGDGPDEIELALPAGSTVGRTRVAARAVPLAEALSALPTMPVAQPDPARANSTQADPARVHPALAAWAAATAGVALVACGRLLPIASPGGYNAWRIRPLGQLGQAAGDPARGVVDAELGSFAVRVA